MKPEVKTFLEELDEQDVKEFQDFLSSRRSRKWIYSHANVLVKGLIFLITSWLLFENFVKHIFAKFIN